MSSAKKCSPFQNKYEIPPHLLADVSMIEKCTNDEMLKSYVFDLLDRQSNPLTYGLELLVSMKFGWKKMGSKIVIVAGTLEDWCRINDLSKDLTMSLKALALNKSILLSNETVTKHICRTFKLHEEKDYVMHVIYDLLKDKKYKEAYYLMSALNLENEFSLEEFAFPAFLLDLENLVKAYLQKCPHVLQLKFVKTLDSLHQNSIAIHDFARSLKLGGLDKNKPFFNPKWMKKRLPTYIDFLNIDIRECPNVYMSRVQGAMLYLIRKRYTDEAIEPEAFEELIVDLLVDHPFLQRELLIKLVCLNESADAFMIAKALNLNKNQLPDCLKSLPPPSDEFASLYYYGPQLKNPDDYLPLRLPLSDVKFVNDLEHYFRAVADITENYDVVGIDAEWKPNLGIKDTKLSLLQVAVWDVIYLFDIQTLTGILEEAHWCFILEKLFFNKEILKLGYGLENDVKEFLKVIGCGKQNYSKCTRLVDLQIAFEKLKRNYPDVINEVEIVETSAVEENESKGLSQLCRIMLGKPLNKGEQFSNWERRPLRRSQATYAALDAFCILMIYEKLYRILENLNLTIDNLISMKISSPKQKKKSPIKKDSSLKLKGGKQLSSLKPSEPLAVENFKVVTDCMLNGLGKYLRMFGADVVCLNDGDDPRCALEIAQTEKRIILTCGNRYEKLKGYMPQDMCFCVNNKVDLKRQVAELQKHFDLQLDESTLFSRCSICNGCDFLTVPNQEMLNLWCELVDENTKWQATKTKNRPNTTYKCDIKTSDGTQKTFVSIQLANLSPRVFETVKEFLVCEQCGKVYWDGSHLSRLKKAVSSVIEIQPSSKTFYEALSKESAMLSDIHTSNISSLESKTGPPLNTISEPSSVTKKIYHVDEDDSSEDDIDDIVYS